MSAGGFMDLKIDIIASLVLLPKMIFWIFIHPRKTVKYMLSGEFKGQLPDIEFLGVVSLFLLNLSILSDLINNREIETAEMIGTVFGESGYGLASFWGLIAAMFVAIIVALAWLLCAWVPWNRNNASVSGRVAIVTTFVISLAEICRVIAQSAGDPSHFHTLSKDFVLVPLAGYAILLIYTLYYFVYSLLEYKRSRRF